MKIPRIWRQLHQRHRRLLIQRNLAGKDLPVLDHCNESVLSDADESLSQSNPAEQSVEVQTIGERSLTSLIAELIDLRTKQQCSMQEKTDKAPATGASSTELAAKEGSPAELGLDVEQALAHSALSVRAAPFQPSIDKKKKTQVSQKKGVQGCSPSQMQAAAMQYQAAYAQIQYQAAAQAQMAQLAYLQRFQSAQMAQYQAAYWQAHMNRMKMGQRNAC